MKKSIKMNVEGVNLVILDPTLDTVPVVPGLTVRLGKMAVSYIYDGNNQKVEHYHIVASLDDVVEKLSAPYTRNLWEKQLRYELGISKAFREIFAPKDTTDVFPTRFNPTYYFSNMGWKNSKMDLKDKIMSTTSA